MITAPKSMAECKELYAILHYLEHIFSNHIDGSAGFDFMGNIIPFDDAVVFAHLLSARKAYGNFKDFPELPHEIYDLDRESVAAFQAYLSPSRLGEVFDRARQLESAIGATTRAMISAIRNRMNSLSLEYGSDLGPENLVPTWHRLSADYSSLCCLIPEIFKALGEEDLGCWQAAKDEILEAILTFRGCFDWGRLASRCPEEPTLINWTLGSDFQAHLENLRGHLSTASSMLESLREVLMAQVASSLSHTWESYCELEGYCGPAESISIPLPAGPDHST